MTRLNAATMMRSDHSPKTKPSNTGWAGPVVPVVTDDRRADEPRDDPVAVAQHVDGVGPLYRGADQEQHAPRTRAMSSFHSTSYAPQ